jgi:hypothetical protein
MEDIMTKIATELLALWNRFFEEPVRTDADIITDPITGRRPMYAARHGDGFGIKEGHIRYASGYDVIGVMCENQEDPTLAVVTDGKTKTTDTYLLSELQGGVFNIWNPVPFYRNACRDDAKYKRASFDEK